MNNDQSKKLKLLFITQKIDCRDDLLGSIYAWLNNLAVQVERLEVICLFLGEHHLPPNVFVHSLGKEKGLAKLGYVWNFYKIILPLIFLKKINGIFVHMNQIYVYLLWPLWPVLKISHIALVWWKAHAKLSRSAKLARFLVDRVVTSVAVAYNINSSKRRIIGQGIDTEKFRPKLKPLVLGQVDMAAIGRISPVRQYEVLLLALNKARLNNPGKNFSFWIYGQPALPSDQAYFVKIKKLLVELNLQSLVFFAGAVPNADLPEKINQADFIVNPGGSGSLDKSIVEAYACGKIVVDSNQASQEILAQSDLTVFDRQIFSFIMGRADSLSEAIQRVIDLPADKRQKIEQSLRRLAVDYHDVSLFNKKIIKNFEELIYE